MQTISKSEIFMAHMFLNIPSFVNEKIADYDTVMSQAELQPEFLKNNAGISNVIQNKGAEPLLSYSTV